MTHRCVGLEKWLVCVVAWYACLGALGVEAKEAVEGSGESGRDIVSMPVAEFCIIAAPLSMSRRSCLERLQFGPPLRRSCA
jgi:hypothetical protein